MERVFPLLQVRFIAVNDGYDSGKRQYGAAGDLDVEMRSLINKLYSAASTSPLIPFTATTSLRRTVGVW